MRPAQLGLRAHADRTVLPGRRATGPGMGEANMGRGRSAALIMGAMALPAPERARGTLLHADRRRKAASRAFAGSLPGGATPAVALG